MKNLKLMLLTLFLLPLMAMAQEVPRITTTSEELSGGTVGKNDYWWFYSDQSSVTWSVEGDLPEGFTLAWNNWENNYSYVSGTPTTEGELTFTLKVTNSAGSSTKTFTVNVAMPEPPVITTASPLADGTMGESYYETLEAADYAQWSIASGSLPPGLNLSSYSGEIYGTPTVADTYNFTVMAKNVTGSDTKNYTITIGAEQSAPIIGAASLSNGTVGQSYHASISSNLAANWSKVNGDLPPGLSIDYEGYRNYIYISGQPAIEAANKSYTFTLKAENSIGSDTKEFTIDVVMPPPPQITSSGSLNAVVGKQEQWELRSNQRVTWSVEGDLPSGFRLQDYGNNDYTYISGTPPTAGEFTFTLRVTNLAELYSTKEFTINVTTPDAPEITTASPLGNGIMGEYYSKTLEATDYAQWSIISGSLPPGLNLSSNSGEISGTPTAADTYNFTVMATNVTGSDTETYTITIEAETSPPVIAATNLPNGTEGQSYGWNINSDRAANWSITGNLPPGLSVNTTGYRNQIYINGTPTAAGEFTFTIIAANSLDSDTKTYTMTIGAEQSAPVIGAASLPSGTVGQNYSVYISSNLAANWSKVNGYLPPGLNIDFEGYRNDIYISGQPTIAAADNSYTFTLKAENSIGSDTKEFTIDVVMPLPPEITSSSTLHGVVGKNSNWELYSDQNVIWSVEGDLPEGFRIDDWNWRYGNYISGSPTEAGELTFTLKVTNYAGLSSTKTFTINVEAAPTPEITTNSEDLSGGIVGKQSSWQFYSDQRVMWEVEGGLPPGLEMWNYGNSDYTRLSGTPTTAGEFTFTLKVTNSAGLYSTKEFTVNVSMPASPEITTNSLVNGTVGESYSQTLETADYVQWSIASGSLPPGLSIGNFYDGYGYISGTPTAAGIYNFTVMATNVTGSDTETYTITIDAETSPPVITATNLPNGTEGQSYGWDIYSDRAANWSITGDLPPGLYMQNYADNYRNNVYIYGNPTMAAVGNPYTFTLTATNSKGSDSKSFTITINAAQEAPKITDSSVLSEAVAGTNYDGYYRFGYLTSNQGATWSMGGDVPPGLEIFGYGDYAYIRGTPTAAGEFTFKVKAENSAGSDSATFTVNIANPPVPVIATASLENGTENEYYDRYIEAENVNYWEISGELPPGLDTASYNEWWGSALQIFGYPTIAAAGNTYTFTVRAVNVAGYAEKTYTIAISRAGQAPVIEYADLPNGIVGKNYQGYLYAYGYAAWSLEEGSLPPGLEIFRNDNSFRISGYPTTAGEFTFTVKAENSRGFDEKTFTVNIAMPQAPVIANLNLPNGAIDKLYSEKLDAATDYAQWSKVSGSLPPGLNLHNSGEISGYPTTAGTYNFAIRATNVAGFDQKSFTIVIGELEQPQITTIELPNGIENKYYSETISSDRLATWITEDDDLPPGLYFDNYYGYATDNIRILGYPTTVGTYSFTVKAENSVGYDEKTFTINVEQPPPPQITTNSEDLPGGIVGKNSGWQFYSDQYVMWDVEGSLPEGFYLDYYWESSSNYITGIPTEAGDFTFTLKVTNSAGLSSTKTFTINVEAAPTPEIATNSEDLPGGIVGKNSGWGFYSDQYVTWDVIGDLPPWLRMGNYGNSDYTRLSGTPTTEGTYNFTLKVTNSAGLFSTKEFTINVAMPDAPEITTDLPDGIMGEYYSKTLEATDYAQWSISGSLPPGLYFDYYSYEGYGIIRGTPTTAGTYNFTVKATNIAGSTEKSFTITISTEPSAPVITTTSLPNGTEGQYYGGWSVNSDRAANWSITGDLPPGLNIDTAGYRDYISISGYPTMAAINETYTFTLTAANSIGGNSKSFTITINAASQAPKITNSYVLSEAVAGINYDDYYYGFGYLNSSLGATWSMGGNVPPGLEIFGYGREAYIRGTPTTAGEFTFTVKAENSAGSDSATFTVNIANPPVPVIVTTSLGSGIENGHYQQYIEAENVNYWEISGELPPGLDTASYNYGWGPRLQISGYPTIAAAGETYTFTVRAVNAAGYYDEKTYTIAISRAGQAPVIEYADLPNGIVGKSYGEYLYANGYAAWSLKDGSLPPGISLYYDYYGEIYGTPTTAGEFTFTVKAENSRGSDEKTFSINIAMPQAPVIATADLPNGAVDKYYSEKLDAATNYAQWSKVSGSLPPGLYLHNSGEIYGYPTVAGEFTFTVKAENVIDFDQKSFTIVIGELQPPQITGTDTIHFVANTYYQVSLPLNSDQRSVIWSREGDLPEGLNLIIGSMPANYFSGTPRVVGTYDITLKVTNSAGLSSTKVLTINVKLPDPPVIATASLDNGTVGEYYFEILEAAGYAQWSIASGSLPPGLYIENYYDDYGRISGYPAEVGTYTFAIRAENAAGYNEKEFSITISAEQSPPVIAYNNIPLSGKVGQSYWGYIESDRAANWSIPGNLPPGISMESYGDDYRGYIYLSGTPTAAGEFTFKVKAANSIGSDSITFTVNIELPQLPVIATASLGNGKMGEYYSETLEAAEYAEWSVASGSLPSGLSIENSYNGYGEISGYPAEAGTYTFTIRATNAAGYNEKEFSIAISAELFAPVIAYNNIQLSGEVGQSYGRHISSDRAANWSISGSLPPGLSMRNADGYTDYVYISGFPTTEGIYSFTLKATNSVGSDSITYSITISAETSPPVITYNYIPSSGKVAQSYEGEIYSDRAANWSITGNLPPGLSIENADYTDYVYISGTPTEAGEFTFTVKAENSVGSDSETYTITINYTEATCIAAGKKWENKQCRAKTLEEVCTDEDKIWENNTCQTEAEIAEAACIAAGKVWENEQCRAKTLEEVCTDEDKIWENNTCQTEAEIAEAACIAAGKVWENEQCRAKTPEEVCTAENKIWENNTCQTEAEIAEAACIAAGKVWVNGECTSTTPANFPQIAVQVRMQSISNAIMLENLPHNAKVEAYNLQGKQIYSATSHSPLATSLSIPVSATGIYIIKVSLGSQKQILRVPVK